MIKSETGLVWSDKFEGEGVLLERSAAGGKVAWYKRWVGCAILSGGNFGANIWHAEFESGIEHAHAANRAGDSKDEMFFGNFWFFNHDWSRFWLSLFFHGRH